MTMWTEAQPTGEVPAVGGGRRPRDRRSGGPGRRRKFLLVGAAGLAVLMVLGAVAGLLAYRRLYPEPPLRADAPPQPAQPLTLTDDPARGSIAFAASGQVVPGPEVEVVVEPPPGATEMQIGLDPTFTTVDWVPVAPTTTLRIDDGGYQMLFGRFRTSSGPGEVDAGADAEADPADDAADTDTGGGEVSPVSVDGITIDPTYEAATSSATGMHRPSWVRPMSPTTVVVRIEAGRISHGAQEIYDFDNPPAGDDVSTWRPGPATVERNGEPYGRQVDGTDNLLRPYDRLVGQPLDGEALTGGPWTISSTGDTAFGAGIPPAAIEHIARAVDAGTGPGDEAIVPLVHDLVLQLPAPLTPGQTYQVTPPPDVAEPVELVVDPAATRSPAVHVNQNGYAPDDLLKVGYLSGLFGGIGGDGLVYAEGTPFQVVDAATGDVVHTGTTVRRPGATDGDGEMGRGDLTGAEVFELDFSSMTAPGRYRVCVDGAGCSGDFAIDDQVWLDVTIDVARALYHQRSGVALGPPYTAIGRPRPYHPDDGLVVNESSYRYLDTLTDPLDIFDDMVTGRTDTVVPDAYGGHFDAGDWDRRIEHLWMVRDLADLVAQHPDLYAELDLGIPESGDQVPDLLDEAMWTLDLFARLQREDGAVGGGVEASEHPQPDHTSWSDNLAISAYAPDPWSSYIYAGSAARVATVLGPYDATRAADYAESALQAMAWAEAQPIEPDQAERIAAHRSVAAVALLEQTGDRQWHDVFVEATTLDDGVDAYLSCHEYARCDAAWIYLGIDPSLTDPGLRSMIEQSFVATADEIVAAASTTAFGWAVENQFVPLIWGLGPGGSPNAIGLMRAYELTGDERYRSAALRSAAVSLGANPTNTSFVTGTGTEPARYPLVVDSLNGGLPVWPGTPVYGYHQLNAEASDGWVDNVVLGPAGTDPLAADLPYLWQWFDVPSVAMFNEYTIFGSHGPALQAFGSLAAS